MNTPKLLIELAKDCKKVWDSVSAEDSDIFGLSLLDLMADNIPDASLADLKSAIVASGIYTQANYRIQRQIASYR